MLTHRIQVVARPLRFVASSAMLTLAVGAYAEVPPNAVGLGDTWMCNNGYEQVGDTCRKLEIPRNAIAVGSTWYCSSGFKRVGDSCQKFDVPENAIAVGNTWYCESGYRRIGDICEKLKVPANALTIGDRWICDLGFKKVAETCVEMSLNDKAKQSALLARYGAMEQGPEPNSSDTGPAVPSLFDESDFSGETMKPYSAPNTDPYANPYAEHSRDQALQESISPGAVGRQFPLDAYSGESGKSSTYSFDSPAYTDYSSPLPTNQGIDVGNGGSAGGRIQRDGRILSEGQTRGRIQSDGRILVPGQPTGRIQPDGRILGGPYDGGRIQPDGRILQ